MKKKAGILATVAAVLAGGIVGLKKIKDREKKKEGYTGDDDSVKKDIDSGLRHPADNQSNSNKTNKTRDDFVCYYGCPNSKRVKKLNLDGKKA